MPQDALIELQTPCLVLDRSKLRRNISSLQQKLATLGVTLRPHGKTAKSIDVMRLALQGQAGGVTVSTLKEAEYYFENGIVDLIYAVGVAPNKLPRIAALIHRGAQISLILDSLEQAKMVANHGREQGLTFSVLIEIDCDGHRSGLSIDDPALLLVARYLHQAQGVRLGGVLTHAGGSYSCTSTKQIANFALQERDAAVSAAATLRAADLPCDVVSIGSTPTATFAEDLRGVTEVRAGVFMFQDLVMVGLGVCEASDVAMSVLTSVIGHQKERGFIISDAGWMALSRDRGTASQVLDQGYGLVCNAAGEAQNDLIVSAANQEHGMISSRSGQAITWEKYPIGTLLRILPNHACATSAMFERYFVVDGCAQIADVWPRINGW
ncbi:MAG: alanine racemase [Planctomycetes bacterium]|nr:alanine racemase [Planctomycetota bacterium]